MLLTQFKPIFYFYTPCKRQKASRFLMLSRGIEMKQWLKSGWIGTENKVIYSFLFTYLFRKHKYMQRKNTSYKFKQKYVCRWPVENQKYVLLPGTFKHRHHIRDKLLITFVWSPSEKYALQGSLLFKFKADYYNFKYSVLDIN